MNKPNQKTFQEYVCLVKKLWSENTESRVKSNSSECFDTIEDFLQTFGNLTLGKYFMYIINPTSGEFDYVSPQAKSIIGL